jgi:hypothetical protein
VRKLTNAATGNAKEKGHFKYAEGGKKVKGQKMPLKML